MTYRIAIALLLAMAPAAHAGAVTDDTPARAITIGKPDGDMKRLVVAPGVMPMKDCKQALEDNKAALSENSVAIFCLPADMSGSVTGELPFIDLTE